MNHVGFYMGIVKTIFLLSILIFLSGCISFSNLDKSAMPPNKTDKSIIVLGVKQDYRVAISKGKIADNKVELGSIATLNTFPDNGYIVGEVDSAVYPEEYHIQLILPDGISGFAPTYGPCGNQKIISFFAPSGKVVYVGDISMDKKGSGFIITLSKDIDNASLYINREYPNLKDLLETEVARYVPIKYVDCSPKTIEIPVVVGT